MSFEVDVRVVPRSRQSKVSRQPDGTLKVWLHAPPVEGQANEALCELLAKTCRLPKRSVEIVKGEASRQKRVRFEGIEPSALWDRLS